MVAHTIFQGALARSESNHAREDHGACLTCVERRHDTACAINKVAVPSGLGEVFELVKPRSTSKSDYLTCAMHL